MAFATGKDSRARDAALRKYKAVNTVIAGNVPIADGLRQQYLRNLHRLHDETYRLSESSRSPGDYFPAFLRQCLDGTLGCAAAVWLRNSDGGLALQAHLNGEKIGLQPDLASHEPYLHQVLQSAQPLYVPSSGPDAPLHMLFAPVLVEGRVAGIVQVWRDGVTTGAPTDILGQFLNGMAHYVSLFVRNQEMQQLSDARNLWDRLEQFNQRIHQSLDLDAVAYLTVADGRALIPCDRLTVLGPDSAVLAVSGVDVVDRRAPQIRLMRSLDAAVRHSGEPLTYTGAPDESLPPAVRAALDPFLAESPSQLLVVLPLTTTNDKRVDFSLVVECFETTTELDVLRHRLEVLGRHAAPALANAARYRRIPGARLLETLGECEEQLYRRRGLRWIACAVVALAVLGALVHIPAPLRMDARGKLLPCERRSLYSPVEGRVVRFAADLKPGSVVHENQPIVLLHDTQLELKLVRLTSEITAAESDIAAISIQAETARNDNDRLQFAAEKRQKEFVRERKLAELKALRERTCSDPTQAGYFWLRTPISGCILSWDFCEQLTNRAVKPSEPLVQIGDKSRGWEIDLRIPQRQIGPVLEMLKDQQVPAIDVDLVLANCPTRQFRGKLERAQLGLSAGLDADSEGAPAVRAVVRVDGPDIPESMRLPVEMLLPGVEVHAKVCCGNRSLGYTLFHGVWEFFAERFLLF